MKKGTRGNKYEKMDYGIRRISNIKFEFINDKGKCAQDQYNRAFASESVYDQEKYANLALYRDSEMASHITDEFFRKNRINSTFSKDTFENGGEDVLKFDGSRSHVYEWVSEYSYEAPDYNMLDDKLYNKLYKFSLRTPIHKFIVGWFIYESEYLELLSEEQLEYWETDFEIFDILADAKSGKATKITVLKHLNIDWNEFNRIRAELRGSLSQFRSLMV